MQQDARLLFLRGATRRHRQEGGAVVTQQRVDVVIPGATRAPHSAHSARRAVAVVAAAEAVTAPTSGAPTAVGPLLRRGAQRRTARWLRDLHARAIDEEELAERGVGEARRTRLHRVAQRAELDLLRQRDRHLEQLLHLPLRVHQQLVRRRQLLVRDAVLDGDRDLRGERAHQVLVLLREGERGQLVDQLQHAQQFAR